MAVRNLLSAAPTERVGRYPKHTFRINSQPFHIQPFFTAPVLAGETLTNLHFEARAVSDPVLNKIIGWKKEYYFFYCRMSILGVQAFKDMFVDPVNTDLTATYGIAGNTIPFYGAKGGINWTVYGYNKIIDHYFRDLGTSSADYKEGNGICYAQIRENTWMDSMTDSVDMPEGANIAGATDAGDLDRLMDAFEQLRALGMTRMTYEDFLRGYGIAVPEQDEGKPELIARFTDWQYPSNTVTQGTGVVTSALSWVFKNSERKPLFFREPGFIIGVTVTRPKVYFSGLAGQAVGFMSRAWDWAPNYLEDMPEVTLKNFAADAGPLGDRTAAQNSIFVDMRDLLLHGDQWHNVQAFDVGLVGNYADHMLPLPPVDPSAGAWKYPNLAMSKGFFVDAGGTKYYVREDGYVSLSIKGKQVDYTQSSIGVNL